MRIPLALRGESAASTHFENVRGAKASPNGRTEYWYAVPSKANLRNRLWCGAIWMGKYASFKSTDTNQSPGRICARICFSVIILNGRLQSALLMGLKSRIGRSWPAGPHNVRSRTRPAPPRRGPGPGRRRSEGDDPAVWLVPRRSCIL